jgi:regulator of sirC expression with transglutaminase-like and TPR domain
MDFSSFRRMPIGSFPGEFELFPRIGSSHCADVSRCIASHPAGIIAAPVVPLRPSNSAFHMHHRWLTVVVSLAFGAKLLEMNRLCAQDETRPPPREIARLIAQLDADRFEMRERATRELFEIGLPAVEALQAARGHASAEVRWRAKSLVDSLTVGVRRRELAEFAALPDERLDLEHGMWMIARILDPAVKKAHLTKQLDDLAARVRKQLGKGDIPAAADPEQVVAAIRQVLFVEEGFTGNVADRYHPDNSSLARVLETKKGLPVLLSHLTIAIARRLDVPLVGVPLSGTYIVKYDGTRAPDGFPNEDLFIDPFEHGRLLRAGDEIERAFPGQDAASEPSLSNRDALERMLRNLSSSLPERKDQEQREQVEEFLELLSTYALDAEP